MNRIRCECGQTFSVTTLDGRPRRHCPVCQRVVSSPESVVAQLVEPVEATVVSSNEDEPIVATLISTPDLITAEVVSQDSFFGIWRDGNEVVVDRSHHQFPLRCVQTNAPVSVLDEVDLKFLRNRRTWSLLGSVGRTIGRSMDSEIVPLKFGRSEEWKRRATLMKALGWVLLFVGWLGLGVLRAASRSPTFQDSPALTLFGVMLFFAAIAGLILLVICYRKTVHVSSIDNRFVRLKGVGHHFLITLPGWPNSAFHAASHSAWIRPES